MNALSNIFSILNLDVEDDKEQISTISTASAIDESFRRSGDGEHKSECKGELEVEEASSESYRFHNKICPPSSSLSGGYKLPLVWIDLEMTGLEVEIDRILEIACVVTDGKLTKSVEGPDLVINQSKECLDNMGEWCQEHHAASGLTERVLRSMITEKDAEEQACSKFLEVINFVKDHVGSQTPLLAGNSVYVDFMFLKKYMPRLASMFPHVLVDVSSIMALCIRWFPKEKKAAPTKEKRHRAMDDIKESIMELKYYKESIFKGTRRSK